MKLPVVINIDNECMWVQQGSYSRNLVYENEFHDKCKTVCFNNGTSDEDLIKLGKIARVAFCSGQKWGNDKISNSFESVVEEITKIKQTTEMLPFVLMDGSFPTGAIPSEKFLPPDNDQDRTVGEEWRQKLREESQFDTKLAVVILSGVELKMFTYDAQDYHWSKNGFNDCSLKIALLRNYVYLVAGSFVSHLTGEQKRYLLFHEQLDMEDAALIEDAMLPTYIDALTYSRVGGSKYFIKYGQKQKKAAESLAQYIHHLLPDPGSFYYMDNGEKTINGCCTLFFCPAPEKFPGYLEKIIDNPHCRVIAASDTEISWNNIAWQRLEFPSPRFSGEAIIPKSALVEITESISNPDSPSQPGNPAIISRDNSKIPLQERWVDLMLDFHEGRIALLQEAIKEAHHRNAYIIGHTLTLLSPSVKSTTNATDKAAKLFAKIFDYSMLKQEVDALPYTDNKNALNNRLINLAAARDKNPVLLCHYEYSLGNIYADDIDVLLSNTKELWEEKTKKLSEIWNKQLKKWTSSKKKSPTDNDIEEKKSKREASLLKIWKVVESKQQTKANQKQ